MAIALVSQAGNVGASPQTITFSTTATAGNLLIVCVNAVTTTVGNIATPTGYTQAVQAVDGGGASAAGKIFYKVAAGGETSVVISCSGGVNLGGRQLEVSGIVSPILDKTATNDPAGSGTTCATGSTGTLSNAAEFAVGAIDCDGNWGGASQSWDSSFTATSAVGGNEPVCGYLITAATTALNPTATYPTSRNRIGSIATFMSGLSTVDIDSDLRWLVNGTVDADSDLRWAMGGTLDIDSDLRWSMHGPVGPFTLRTEVAWAKNPLTRPTEGYVGSGGDWSLLSDVSDGLIMPPGLKIDRGMQILSAGLETGTSLSSAENAKRHLDPAYTASTLAPNVVPRRRIRHILTAGGVDKVLATHFIEKYTPFWSKKTAAVAIPTQDLLGIIANVPLPPSVLDVVTRGLDTSAPVTVPTSYWPMCETVFTGQADDVIGSWDGTYVGPVQTGRQLTPYDPRSSPLFARPGTVNGASISTTAMEKDSVSFPDVFSFSCWFQWTVGAYDNVNPAVIILQNGAPPTTAPPGTPLSPTPNQILLYLSQDTIAGYHHINIRVQDGTSVAIVKVPIGKVLLDGQPHHLAFSVTGSTKTITTWMDGYGGTAGDTGIGGTVNLSTLNVSSIIASLNCFGVGWGINWQNSAATTADSAVVGSLSYWASHVLTGTEAGYIYAAGTSAWNGDLTHTRLGRVCDLIGIDTNDRLFDTGTQICGPTTLGSQNFLAYIRKIVQTELGVLYVNGDGKIRFRARPSSPPVIQTFSDAPATDAGVPCGPLAPDNPYDRIINSLTASRENGADQLVQDATSLAKYGPLSGSISGGKIETLHQLAADALTTAQLLITNHKTPVTVIPSVSVEAIDRNVSYDAMVGVEIGDLVVIKGRPPGTTAETLGIQAQVEHVEYSFPTALEFVTVYTPGDGTYV